MMDWLQRRNIKRQKWTGTSLGWWNPLQKKSSLWKSSKAIIPLVIMLMAFFVPTATDLRPQLVSEIVSTP
ncbi:MAG: hypothetical protein ACFFAY_15135, partial [Promethearchaeota archaeon]